MLSLLLRNALFTVLQPGVVVGLIPYLILRAQVHDVALHQAHQYGALVLAVVGLIVMLRCILNFAVIGRGTLSPIDPTRRLVIVGLYKYSRNPMYIGVLLMLIAEPMFFGSYLLCIYTALMFAVFHAFILLHEEPRLCKDFGDEYAEYMARVPRWI